MNVRVLDVVDDDLVDAARYLDLRQAGLGDRLLREYAVALEAVERFPAMYPLVDDELPGREARNALLGRLKYRLVYEVRAVEVLVVAVLHTSRRPDLWHSRLADE